MRTIVKSITTVFLGLITIQLLSGCTNWQKKYEALNVEHQNLKGLEENCRQALARTGSEKDLLAKQLDEGQQTIEELKKQIEERNASLGDVSGFGDKYDVSLDEAAGTITVTLRNTILFPSGKASLKKSSNADLNHIVSVLQEDYSNRPIDVVGHTDAEPISKSKWKDNWELSAQRSLSIVRYLISQGIPGERLRAIGCGATRPVAPNATASGKARNRRVEIVVHMR